MNIFKFHVTYPGGFIPTDNIKGIQWFNTVHEDISNTQVKPSNNSVSKSERFYDK